MLRLIFVTVFVFPIIYVCCVGLNSGGVITNVWEGKIVGGEDADITDAPYQAAMLYGSGVYQLACGGSIIKANVIASAAHCPFGTTSRNWKVRVGSTYSNSGGQLLNVKIIIMHPNYNSRTYDYDIALYVLTSSIQLDGSTTRIIPLPARNAVIVDDTPAFVTGWGATTEGGDTVTDLQKVTIPIVNQLQCSRAYINVGLITSRMLCAGLLRTGGKDSCQGDSGGPLAINGVLFGITSWGRGCAQAGYPGIWTRVPYFRNWIDLEIAKV